MTTWLEASRARQPHLFTRPIPVAPRPPLPPPPASPAACGGMGRAVRQQSLPLRLLRSPARVRQRHVDVELHEAEAGSRLFPQVFHRRAVPATFVLPSAVLDLRCPLVGPDLPPDVFARPCLHLRRCASRVILWHPAYNSTLYQLLRHTRIEPQARGLEIGPKCADLQGPATTLKIERVGSCLMTAIYPSMTECCFVHGFVRSPRWSSWSY